MARIDRTIVFRFLLLTVLSSTAWAQSPVTDDTYIVSGSSTIQGTNPSLQVASPSTSSLLKFDLSGLPAGTTGAQVLKATVKLYVTTVALPGNLDVCLVNTSWSEKTLIYSSRPTLFNIPALTNVPISTASKYVILDITPIVQGWLNAPATNLGIAILPSASAPCSWSTTPSSVSVVFDSKESTTSSHDAGLNIVLAPTPAQIPNLSGSYVDLSSAQTIVGAKHFTSKIQGDLNGTADNATFAINAGHANVADTANHATNADNALSAVSATNAQFAVTAGHASSADSATTAGDSSKLGGQPASSYARLDLANLFAQDKKQTFTAGSNFAGLNIGSVAADPQTPATGDLWLTTGNTHLMFRDNTNATQSLAFTSDIATATSGQTSALTSEITRAEGAEGTLTTSLAGEVARATGAEMLLSTSLGIEVTRATAAEAALNSSLTGKANLAGGNAFTGDQTVAGFVNATSSTGDALVGTSTNNTGVFGHGGTGVAGIANGTNGSIGVRGDASVVDGNTHYGVEGVAADTHSIAGVFDHTAGGKILSGRNNGAEVFSVDGNGKVTGDGSGLTGVQASTLSPSATIQGSQVIGNIAGDAASITGSVGESQVSGLTNDLTSLNTAIAGETTRAVAAEASLSFSIAAETTRATGAEAALNTSLTGKASLAGGNAFTGDQTVAGFVNATSSTGDALVGTSTNNTGVSGHGGNGVAGIANGTDGSIGVRGDASVVDGHTHYGVEGVAADATNSIAGVFDHTAGGKILSGRNNGAEVFSVSGTGKVTGDGSGLMGVQASTLSPSATIGENQVTGLSTDLANTLNSAEAFATTAAGTAQTNAEGFATTAAAAAAAGAVSTAEGYSDAQLGTAVSAINTSVAGKASLAGGNLFTGGKQTLADAVAGYASLNVPNSATAPSSPVAGDLWLLSTDPHLQFQDKNNATQMLAFSTDVTAANSSTLSTAESFATTAASTAQTNAETFATTAASTAQSNAEAFATTAAAAAAAGAVSTAEGYSDAQLGTAVSTINTSVAGKASLAGGNLFTGGKQTLADAVGAYASLNVPNSATAPTTPVAGDVWLLNTDPHLQFQDKNNATQTLAFSADVTAANSSTLSTAESFATTAATTAQTNAEAFATTAAAAAAAGAVTTAEGYSDAQLGTAVGTINTSVAGKASLAGGNSFTGVQALAPLSGVGAQASNLLRLNSTNGTTPQSAQFQARTDGGLSFQFGPTSGPITENLSIDNTGKFTFAAGQTFPGVGTVTSITAGTGLSGGTITTSGTVNLVAATGATLGGVIAPLCGASSHYSSIISGTLACTADTTTTSLSFSAITAGTNATALTIGNGGSLNVSGTGTINATSLSGELAATGATAGTIAARDASGNLTATQFNGSGVGLTNVPTTSLTGAPVRVTATTTSAANPGTGTTVTATASCPAGRVLLGGGAQVTNTQAPDMAVMSQSFPSSTSPTGQWTVVGVVIKNMNAGNTMTVTAYALCSGS